MDVGVIGGSRYIGKRLIRRLLAAGHRVTVINRGSAAPPPGATGLIADRDDEAALRAALGDTRFDVVIDQVCYNPVQAAIAASVFADRTSRYVMTSTVEVYAAGARAEHTAPVTESAVWLDPGAVDVSAPWHDDGYADAHYGEGKRQAETVLTVKGGFEFAAVRSAHVMGGEDFTGRLAHYVERVRAGRAVDVHDPEFPATFIHVDEIAAVLAWAAAADFTGPLNASSHGELTARALCELIPSETAPRPRTVPRGTPASPFSFPTYYAMDNSRAGRLGFDNRRLGDWLPGAIAELTHER